MKGNIKGKVILISDTDDQLVDYDVSESKHLFCYRFVNDHAKKKTILVSPSANPKSPSTCVEDILNVDTFLKTIAKYYSNDPLLTGIENDKTSDMEVDFSLDLKRSQQENIKKFFAQSGIKYDFAKKYTNECKPAEEKIPGLFTEINHLLSKN